MADSDLLDEIDDLKEKLDIVNSELQELRDEREHIVEDYEFKILTAQDKIEEEWRKRLENTDNEHRDQLATLVAELDALRLAFSGDSDGWVERTTKGGDVFYENTETGQVQENEPECLYIARAMRKVDEAEAMKEEFETLKTKYKDLDIKKKEADLVANRAKTEMNSLRAVDKSWRESAKTIYLNLKSIKDVFETQCDQVIDSLSGISKVSARIHQKVPLIRVSKQYIADLQQKNRKLDEVVSTLNGKIRVLTADIEEKQLKINRLSAGIEEEIERLVKPMRERLADSMVLVMKEKAARSQERREIAALWPANELMPSILMKYRSLSHDEKERRKAKAQERAASLALSIEIRANVAERKKWEMKYDDYGRPFYQHAESGEICWEEPAILNYTPPPGRDEDGNVIEKDVVDMAKWKLESNNRGEVFFINTETGETTFTAPYAYEHIPKGKPTDVLVSEAAHIVLNYVKQKITTHIQRVTKVKHSLENPLTPEEQLRKEKEEKNKAKFEGANGTTATDADVDPESIEDLGCYLYDIETIEMIAARIGKRKADDGEDRSFLRGQELRNFDAGVYVGPTLYETDVTEMNVDQLREIVEHISTVEEKLELRLNKARENLKDFSFVLMEKLKEWQKERAAEQRRVAEEKLKLQKQKEKEERRAERRRQRLKREREDSEAANADDGDDDEDNEEDAGETNGEEKVVTEAGAANIGGGDGVEPSKKRQATDGNNASSGGLELGMEPRPMTGQSTAEDSKGAATDADDEDLDSEDGDDTGTAESDLTDGETANRDNNGPHIDLEFGTLLVGEPEIDPKEGSYPQEMLDMCSKLSSLSLFCGFTNAHMEELPDFVGTNELSLHPEEQNKYSDDRWLTASFYINISREKVDAIRELIARPYDSTHGLLFQSPVDSLRLSFDAQLTAERNAQLVASREKNFIPGSKKVVKEYRDVNQPWTPGTLTMENKFQMVHAFWKARQFMGELLRYQFQQEAVRDAADGKLRESMLHPNGLPRTCIGTDRDFKSISLVSNAKLNYRGPLTLKKPLMLKVRRITLRDASPRPWSDMHAQYIQIAVGGFAARTPDEFAVGRPMVWSESTGNLNVAALISLDRLQMDDMVIEVYDRNHHATDTLMGTAAFPLSRLIGANAEREVDISTTLKSRIGHDVGTLLITLIAYYPPEPDPRSDPDNLGKTEEIFMNDPVKVQKIDVELKPPSLEPSETSNGDDALSAVYPSVGQQLVSFQDMVDDMRGDGDSLMRMLTGDIKIDGLLNRGFRISEHTVKNLPDLNFIKAFVKRKSNLHVKQVQNAEAELEGLYEAIQTSLTEKFEAVEKEFAEIKDKYKQVSDVAETAKVDALRVRADLDEIGTARPKPKQPEFPDLPEVPYCKLLPTNGGLDSRGKKKGNIPSKEFKALQEAVIAGAWDDKEWDFGDYWPSKGQQDKISKTTTERNKTLDAERAFELQKRAKAMELYQDTVVQWEGEEKKRKQEHNRVKKESRKVNVKYSCCQERAERVYTHYSYVEMDIDTFREMKELHEKSMVRFKTMKIKYFLETERQVKAIETIKRRLLSAVDARRRALDLPQGATSKLEFESLCKKSEEALRSLRVEIFECREIFVQEGKNLRTLQQEEYSCVLNELNRAKMFKDIIYQRTCIDRILDRNRYEVLHLMESMEKLRLIEAEKDDNGKDTIDDLGEIFKPDKVWESPEITKCTRLVELVMNKINLMEGVSRTAGNCQRCLVESITTKWGVDFTPVRDSWTENSDYERAQRLQADAILWVAHKNRQLADKERQLRSESNELRLQLDASLQQAQTGLQVHDHEALRIAQCASDIVTVLQNQLDVQRVSAKEIQAKLESNITDLSRECQKVREDLLAQALSYEEKMKVLWAIIATMQATVQHISVKMDIFVEERDRIVIKSRLECDKLRGQMRRERRYSSSLLFIIHSQNGFMKYYQEIIKIQAKQAAVAANANREEKLALRRDVWEQVFTFTRLCTDVDALFEFFATRLANLAGARKAINESLASNGAAAVLAALCRSPRTLIRKHAARALAGMGWDGYVETRILLWDSVMSWKVFKAGVLAKERHAVEKGFVAFADNANYEALLNIEGKVEEFAPSGNLSLRNMIKQRRQWALRTTRRIEGPNFANQRLINVKDGVLPALLDLCARDGDVDWEIPRNAALAISVASYEAQNHHDMVNDQACVQRLLLMCRDHDVEVRTHAAVTIANLCHKDEHSQTIFGNSGAVPALLTMCQSTVPDVLEAATAALSNLTCFCDPNCQRVMDHGGVKIMIDLVANAFSENLLDIDQNDEVQSNAAEMLANTSRYSTEACANYFDGPVVDALVVMCASKNKQVRRHAPLVMGNVAQSERCREEIGSRGGIEALFLVLEDVDPSVQANTLWALCNLMWHPPNQERAGRFMGSIVAFLAEGQPSGPIRTYASTLLANVLYYNNANRVRFLETEGAMELIMGYIAQKEDRGVIEGCLRSVLSLSYLDQVALWLGNPVTQKDDDRGIGGGNHIPLFLDLLRPHYISRDIMRYSLEILCNLCVHHSNRRTILDCNGIDAIVSLQGDPDRHVSELSQQTIKLLEDVTPAEVLARAKENIGLERMVALASDSDPLVRAVAAESIGEEVWHDPKKQRRAVATGGVDALLAIVHRHDEPVDSLLPALWSMRNLLHNCFEGQSQFHHRDGVGVVVAALTRCATSSGTHAHPGGSSSKPLDYREHTEKIMEACLACLATAVANHERNSRRLVVVGLEVLMDLAEGRLASPAARAVLSSHVVTASQGESVVALAKTLMLMLAPYNYVVCRNCQKKQDLNGTNCIHCGNRLRVEVVEREAMSFGLPGLGSTMHSISSNNNSIISSNHKKPRATTAGAGGGAVLSAVSNARSMTSSGTNHHHQASIASTAVGNTGTSNIAAVNGGQVSVKDLRQIQKISKRGSSGVVNVSANISAEHKAASEDRDSSLPA